MCTQAGGEIWFLRVIDTICAGFVSKFHFLNYLGDKIWLSAVPLEEGGELKCH